jgi:hypothetical protein
MSLHFHTSLKRTSSLLERSLSLIRAVNTSYFQITDSLSLFLIAGIACTSHLFKFFSSFLPTDSLQVYKNMCGSLVRRWRSAVPFSGGGTHTHTHYTPLAWKEARKRDEESRVWSTRRVINERRIPADKEEPPPSVARHPIWWPHNPRLFRMGHLLWLYIPLFSFHLFSMAYQTLKHIHCGRIDT